MRAYLLTLPETGLQMKFIPAALLLFVLFCFSCKKSSTTTTTAATNTLAANIDSIKGYYAGTTKGDSIYYYTDTAGKVQYGIRTFSSYDSLIVTSADTANITVASKYYNVTFPYVYYYTLADSTTYLQYYTQAESGYVGYYASLVDSANNVNHITVSVAPGHSKHFASTFVLYKRQ